MTDSSNDFEDIFMGFAPTRSAPKAGSTEKSKKRGTKNTKNGNDLTFSDNSSSSSGEYSIESTTSKQERLFNSSKAAGRKKTCYASKSDSEEDDEHKTGDGADFSDDDLDCDALADFFSSRQLTKTHILKSKVINDLDDDDSSEDVSVIEKKLDDDDLTNLENEEAVILVQNSSSASDTSASRSTNKTKHHSSDVEEDDLDYTPRKSEEDEPTSRGAENKTPFRITYNGEKKKYPDVETLFDSSDEESHTKARSAKPESQAKFINDASKSSKYTLKPSGVPPKEYTNGKKKNSSLNVTSLSNPYQKNKRQTEGKTTSHPSDQIANNASLVAMPPHTNNISYLKHTELQRLSINHDNFKPPKYTPCSEPILHKFDEHKLPVHRRRKIAVDQIFSRPFSNLFTSKFQEFNPLQSEMSNAIANSDDSVIVSSPTGSGKTGLFEMALCRMFASIATRDNRVVSNKKKAVYIAPNKALCEERHADWSERLKLIDPTIICTTITGDTNTSASSFDSIALSNLILTTPEKWDSITRRWTEYVILFGSIKLVMLDEIHMIGEPDRGACLEAVISRMKTIYRAATCRAFTNSEIETSSFNGTDSEALMSNLRFLAVSATMPNLTDVASVIEANEAYAFNDSFRPVPLTVHVQACGHIGKNQYFFDKSLNQHIPSLLHRYSKGRPAIVFCHSKKDTEVLANDLTKSFSSPSSLNISVLNNFANRANTASLQRFLRCGVAYHHAGLEPSDRKVVEEAFMSGSINCLCATSTLAMGVNLPSHLVIIKGTSAYRGKDNGHEDIDTGTLLQMIGRAGRPGFDTTGTAVIMTDSTSRTRFENISMGLKIVQSHLHVEEKLTEVLNCEIAQGVIISEEEAVDWVSGTLLFRRIMNDRLFYGLNQEGMQAASYITHKCKGSIEQLRKIGAIDIEEDGTFSPSVASKASLHIDCALRCFAVIMSYNLLDLSTMRSITKLPHDAGIIQLLHLLSNCKKLQSHVRRNEKKQLNEAYKKIRYKLEGPQSKIRIQTPAEKVFVLIQSAIGNYVFEDFSLRQQMNNVLDGAVRILAAVEEYSKEGSHNGQILVQGLLLRRSIFHGIWSDKDGILKQIGGVSNVLEGKLKSNGISTFIDVINTDSEELSRACSMPSAFCDGLRAAAAMIFHCALDVSSFSKENDDGGLDLVIRLQRKEVGNLLQSQKVKDNVKYSLVVFTDRPGGLLLSCGDVSDEGDLLVKCPKKFGRAYIKLIGNLVGLDKQTTVDGNDCIEKSSFSLSPTVVKTITKNKTSQEAVKKPSELAKKRQLDYHISISDVIDLRLHKRGKIEGGSTEPEYNDRSPCPVSNKTATKKAVTPSPHPFTKAHGCEKNSTATFGSTSRTDMSNPYSSKDLGYTNGSRNVQNKYKWTQEKRCHTTAQQRAFHSPKENPFSNFAYDPNDIESSLNSSAAGSQKRFEQSILPINNSFSAIKARQPTFRIPSSKRKGSTASSRISCADILKQKAFEMNYHQQATVSSQMAEKTLHMQMMRERNHMEQNGYYGRGFDQDPFSTHAISSHGGYYYGRLAGDTMQSDINFSSQYQHHPVASNGYIMNESSIGMTERDSAFSRSNRFSTRKESTPFTQLSYARPILSTDNSHGCWASPSSAVPFTKINRQSSVQYNQPMSSAGNSNLSELQKFSIQNDYAGNLHHQQIFHRNDYHSQEPLIQEHEYSSMYQPQLQVKTHTHDFSMDPQTNQRFGTFHNYFSKLDPFQEGTRGPCEGLKFCELSFNEPGAFQHQPRDTVPMYNPYAKPPPRTIPRETMEIPWNSQPKDLPKEIVLQNNAMDNSQKRVVDDTSLAFDDAFL